MYLPIFINSSSLRTMILKLFVQIFIIILVYFTKLYSSTITCSCTTDDCVAQGRSTCLAPTNCFVEFLQESTDNPMKFHVRGCISESNPLMCDQNLFSPSGSGPKLYLECCHKNYCNENTRPNMKLFQNYISMVQKQMKSEVMTKLQNEHPPQTKIVESETNVALKNQKFQYPLSLIIIIATFCGILLMIILIVVIIKLILIYNHQNYLDNDQIYSVSLSGSSNDPETSIVTTVDSRKPMMYSSNRDINTFYRKLIKYFKFNHRSRDMLT